MTSDEKLALVRQHYALNQAGDHAAAQALLTDDFLIEIPDYMPFGGTYRGKGAFLELIPAVVNSVAVTGMKFVATTVGGDHAVEIVEFTLADDPAPPTQVAELITFRGHQICEIRPFYADAQRFIDAAARRKQAANPRR